MFYSENIENLVINGVMVVLLSLAREPLKCTLPFLVDLFLKSIWIYGFSLLFYLLVFLGQKVLDKDVLTQQTESK